MIDLHIRLLPGVDDGPATLEDSVRMCRMAADGGCQALIATPHQRREWENQDPDALGELLRTVQLELGPQPKLHLGAEILVGDGFLEELERGDLSGLLGLAGSRYLLVEFSDMVAERELETVIHEISFLGYRPVVAHPEFTPQLAESLVLVERLIQLGATMQVTAMAVTGEFGRTTQRIVRRLIDADCVHYIASDAHTPTWRPPGLSRAHEVIRARWGEETALRLLEANPRAVVAAEPLP